MPQFRNFSAIAALTAVAASVTPTAADAAIIDADPDSYRTLFRSLGSQQGAFDEVSDNTLNVSVTDFSGFNMEYYRPILQFDISAMDGPVQDARLSVYLALKTPNAEFDVHVYGSAANRSETVEFDDSGAPSEFFNTPGDYAILHDADESLIDRDDEEDQRYSIDITEFLNARYADYVSDESESIVLIRLQPHTTFEPGDGIDTSFYIGGGGAPAGARARIEYGPIPEPASLALLGAGGLLMLRRRRH